MRCLPETAAAGAPGDKVSIIVAEERGTACTFYNRFTPAGRIVLRKVTLGGTATTTFQVRPEAGAERPERQQVAVTKEAGVPVEASGDALTELPIGTYSIHETLGGPDRWELASVVCNGRPYPAVNGGFAIRLTDEEPELDCTVTNRRIEDLPPPDPPLPPQPPTPPGPPSEPPGTGIEGEGAESPVAELRVRKRVAPGRVVVGGAVRYVITVSNRGPDTARNVTLSEPGATPRRGLLALQPSQGDCRNRPPRFCRFGTLRPGERATVRVRVRTARTGRFVNRVAVNTSTQQSTDRGKRARARVRVVALAPPRYTG